MTLEHEYVGRKLNGGVTDFMLMTESTKFDFVLNPKAAKQIGITLPYELLARANQVIK